MTTILRIEHGAVAFSGRPVLRDLNLTVHTAEVLAILGANGSGKSTLIRAALGLVPLHAGSVSGVTPPHTYRRPAGAAGSGHRSIIGYGAWEAGGDDWGPNESDEIVVDAIRAAQIETSLTSNYPPYLVAAVLFGLFFVGLDLGGGTAGESILWVALGVQLGALPTTLAGALRSRGRRGLGIDDSGLLLPVAVLTVLNLSADAFLAYAVTRGDLAVVAVLASLAPVVTALLAHALTTERPSAPQAAGAALAVLGTLVVSAAQAAG